MNRVEFVIQKYRLNEPTFIDFEVNGKKLGQGQVMSDACLKHFIAGDPSGDNKYLDWMIFMAGGGQEAMKKSLSDWNGQSPEDPNSSRNLCQKQFMMEQLGGYVDEQGVRHEPISQAEADQNWKQVEPRCYFEFVMGDQDIAAEGAFGFFREWPGQGGLYAKIVSAIQLWHASQSKLLARNKAFAKATQEAHDEAHDAWTGVDSTLQQPVELDIYAKWKPNAYSQENAVYNTLALLVAQLSDIRRAQILKDEHYDLIYEDTIVKAIVPLTIGASLAYGSNKWCISNRSEFERNMNSNSGPDNWKNYAKNGPLVFLLFKVRMPLWCSKMAVHIQKDCLKELSSKLNTLPWFDVENRPGTFYRFKDFVTCVQNEHLANYEECRYHTPNDQALALAGRDIERAWPTRFDAREVEASMHKAFEAIVAWGRRFDPSKIVVDYLADPVVNNLDKPYLM